MCRSKGGNQRKASLPLANNFMATHPGQTIIDKNIEYRLLQSSYSEHDFSASKADHDVVGDETENNSANHQTLVVENLHINTPEEPELIANADYDALKKPDSVFYFKPLPKATQCEKKSKSKKGSSSILKSTPIKEMLEQREKLKRKL
ncbi:uncharacterized protein TNCV_2888491 [Trichonephila clavipes]|nr:uncharacterized protein TNCV_2888491 [Trichonephila clavipes]